MKQRRAVESPYKRHEDWVPVGSVVNSFLGQTQEVRSAFHISRSDWVIARFFGRLRNALEVESQNVLQKKEIVEGASAGGVSTERR